MSITINVNLELKTCGCGLVYAIPGWLLLWTCPACARRKIDGLLDDHGQHSATILERDRTISALKGALTKARGSHGRGR